MQSIKAKTTLSIYQQNSALNNNLLRYET